MEDLSTAIIVSDSTHLAVAQPFDVSVLAGVKSPNTLEQYRLHWQTYTRFAGTWHDAIRPATLPAYH